MHPVVEAEDGGALFEGGALGGVLGESERADGEDASAGKI